jgi:hypothetical protein
MQYNKNNQHTFEELVLDHLDRMSQSSFQLASLQNPPLTAMNYYRALEFLETILTPVLDKDYYALAKIDKEKINKDETWKKGMPFDKPFYDICHHLLAMMMIQSYNNNVISIQKTISREWGENEREADYNENSAEDN